jgi:hypothetical protein
MSDLLDIMKPQLQSMQEMYRAGFAAGKAEGKREAFREILETLKEQEIEKCQSA